MRKYFNIGFKIVVASLLLWVLYQQVFGREDIAEIKAVFVENLQAENVFYLVLTLILMPVNWLFETLKWRVLIQKFEQHALWQSYQAILVGVTFSIFTPNRIGEYGGRILLVEAKNNWKTVVATLVGSFSQLLVLLTMGLLGLLVFIQQFATIETYFIRAIAILGLTLILLLFFGFYNVDRIIPLVKRLPFIDRLQKFVKDVRVLKEYENWELTKALIFAFLRYTTYLLQYYFLLQFFGINVSFWLGTAGIATIFLVQTSIPLPPVWDLLVRGEVALQVWGLFGANELSVLAATFSLWIINLIVPALIGMIFMLKINVLKSLGIKN